MDEQMVRWVLVRWTSPAGGGSEPVFTSYAAENQLRDDLANQLQDKDYYEVLRIGPGTTGSGPQDRGFYAAPR